MSVPHPHTILFARGTIARLSLWPALRLAVHASWGGPASTEKQRWLAGVLVDQFESFILAPPVLHSPPRGSRSVSNSGTGTEVPPDDVYVEELLLQIMADEFDVALEDDSAATVAKDVVRLFEAVRAGDDTFVKELEAQAETIKGKVPKHEMGVGSESESGSDWEDEDEDEDGEEGPVPQLLNQSAPRTGMEPQVDEDGFTMVKRKGRR